MKTVKSKSGLLESLLVTAMLLLFAGISHAQPGLPPRTITVTATQPVEFGAFVVTGAGGTITVDWQGVRSSTGGIVLVSASICKPAIFEVKLCPGRNVTITYSPTILLSNGSGGSLMLNIGPTEMGENGDHFIVSTDCNFITPFHVGGTLNIPTGIVPEGIYSGVFDITFTQD
jgi:hypothetical protein